VCRRVQNQEQPSRSKLGAGVSRRRLALLSQIAVAAWLDTRGKESGQKSNRLRRAYHAMESPNDEAKVERGRNNPDRHAQGADRRWRQTHRTSAHDPDEAEEFLSKLVALQSNYIDQLARLQNRNRD